MTKITESDIYNAFRIYRLLCGDNTAFTVDTQTMLQIKATDLIDAPIEVLVSGFVSVPTTSTISFQSFLGILQSRYLDSIRKRGIFVRGAILRPAVRQALITGSTKLIEWAYAREKVHLNRNSLCCIVPKEPEIPGRHLNNTDRTVITYMVDRYLTAFEQDQLWYALSVLSNWTGIKKTGLYKVGPNPRDFMNTILSADPTPITLDFDTSSKTVTVLRA